MATQDEKTKADFLSRGGLSGMSDAERGYASGLGSDLELQHLRSRSPTVTNHSSSDQQTSEQPADRRLSNARALYEDALSRKTVFWDRLKGKGKRKVGWLESLRNAIMSSCTSLVTRLLPAAHSLLRDV